MLNVFFRHAVPSAYARCFGATALACAGLLWMPAAHAAEVEPPEPTASPPFQQYRGWRDEPLQDWREANERVGEIGGWRTYLRESQQVGNGADPAQHGRQGQ